MFGFLAMRLFFRFSPMVNFKLVNHPAGKNFGILSWTFFCFYRRMALGRRLKLSLKKKKTKQRKWSYQLNLTFPFHHPQKQMERSKKSPNFADWQPKKDPVWDVGRAIFTTKVPMIARYFSSEDATATKIIFIAFWPVALSAKSPRKTQYPVLFKVLLNTRKR